MPTDPAILQIEQYLQNERARQEQQRLRDAAIIERYRQGVPQSTPEAISKSAGVGFVDAALNIPINIAGYLPFIGPRMRPAEAEIRVANERAASQVDAYQSPNAAASIAIQAPQTISSIAQDVFSPAARVRLAASLAARAPKIAAFAQQYGPDALATLYHAVRGSADGASGGAISGSGYLVGEKVFEPAALKTVEKLLPRFEKKLEAAAAMGNVGGAFYEKLAAEIADWHQKQDD